MSAMRALRCTFVIMLAFGCRHAANPPTPEDLHQVPSRDRSPVQADSLTYKLVRRPDEFRAFVSATYRNTTGAPVYFARCSPRDSLPMFGVGRTGADSMRSFFVDWDWACVGGVPTGIIAPGQSVSVRVAFGSVDQPRMEPPLRSEQLIGVFRIHLSLCRKYSSDSDSCELLPAAERRSNAFLVHY